MSPPAAQVPLLAPTRRSQIPEVHSLLAWHLRQVPSGLQTGAFTVQSALVLHWMQCPALGAESLQCRPAPWSTQALSSPLTQGRQVCEVASQMGMVGSAQVAEVTHWGMRSGSGV